MDWKYLKKIFVWLLLIDAAYVFYLQITHQNAWAFICLYWCILTIKNAIDVKCMK